MTKKKFNGRMIIFNGIFGKPRENNHVQKTYNERAILYDNQKIKQLAGCEERQNNTIIAKSIKLLNDNSSLVCILK